MLKQAIRDYLKKQKQMRLASNICMQIRIDSKQVIALLRRDNFDEAKKLLTATQEKFKEVNTIAKSEKRALEENFYQEAIEEFIEAFTLFNYLQKPAKKLPKYIQVTPEQMIGGICDFTGELVRKAVNAAGKGDIKILEKYHREIEEVAEELTKIGFKGKLRQKYDEVERNYRRMEQILYDVRLKRS
jgi:predicted translin family RNA/ssDNA-binding protein